MKYERKILIPFEEYEELLRDRKTLNEEVIKIKTTEGVKVVYISQMGKFHVIDTNKTWEALINRVSELQEKEKELKQLNIAFENLKNSIKKRWWE